MFGLKNSTAVHADGWKGDRPSLSIMGYVENKYDKYGRPIELNGAIAGDLSFKGTVSWHFATPVGPMYLKIEPSGKLSLKASPKWNIETGETSVDGTVTVTPALSLTGGYGIERVLSISATGKASLGIQAYPPTKGTLTAEASVTAQVLFVLDYTQTLAKNPEPWVLWNTVDGKKKLTGMHNALAELSEEDLSLMSTDFARKTSKWNGKAGASLRKKAKKTSDGGSGKSVLQSGILPSTLPLLAEVDGKQVMVWQSYDGTRDTANSTVLVYSVLEDGVWSEPEAVLDDGCGDSISNGEGQRGADSESEAADLSYCDWAGGVCGAGAADEFLDAGRIILMYGEWSR